MVTTNNFKAQIDKLPIEAKKIYLAAYTKIRKDKSELDTTRLAWSFMKKYYSKRGKTWIKKQDIKIETNIKKSGLFSQTYSLDLIIGSTSLDRENETVSEQLLQELYNNNLIDTLGDVDHANITFGDDWTQGLFKAVKTFYKNGKIRIKAIADKSHKAYGWFIKNRVYNRIKGASAEYINPVMNGNTIVKADYLGWTVALKDGPINNDSILRKK